MAVIQRTLEEHTIRPLVMSGRRVMQVVALVLVLLALGIMVQQGMQVVQQTVDDLRYGYPRRASVFGYVGHGDEQYLPTLIETFNLNGQISIVVIPGGDVERLNVLAGPYIVGSDGSREVAHPALHDVNGDGHVDLVVTVRNEAVVYVNDNGQFRVMTMEERASLVEEWYEEN